MPSGCTFPLKYKKSQITKSLGSNYLALGSIVIIDSFLHLLQYPGKFLSLVSFRYFIIFGYPHLGHLYQYSSVDICSPLSLSISHCPEYSKYFICPEYFILLLWQLRISLSYRPNNIYYRIMFSKSISSPNSFKSASLALSSFLMVSNTS